MPRETAFTMWVDDPNLQEPAPGLPELVVGPEGDFALKDLLGRGGMAHVYRADQRSLARDVAIKRARDPEQPALQKALLREAWITGQLNHPNIVPVHLIGEAQNGEPVVVLQVVEGHTWEDEIDGSPTHNPDQIDRHLAIFTAICNATHFAHETGFVHRDIKPANVQLGLYGEIYLLDWGIAQALSTPSIAPGGTPAYLAPEMLLAGPADPRSDVYLLGATLLHALTGKPPRGEASCKRLMDGSFTPLELPEDLNPRLREILERATDDDIERRYPDVAELRDAVEMWRVRRAGDALLASAREALDLFEQQVEDANGTEVRAVRASFTTVRRAFTAVLDERNDPEALAGLAQAIRSMARVEFDAENVEGMRSLINLHPSPTAALTAHLHERLETLEAHLAARHDETSGDLGRFARLWAGLAVLLAVVMVLNAMAMRFIFGDELSVSRSLFAAGVPATVSLAAIYWRRKEILSSPVAANLAWVFGGTVVFVFANRISANAAGEPLSVVTASEPFAIAMLLLGLSPLHRAHLPLAGLMLLGGGLLRFVPLAWRPLTFNSLIVFAFVWLAGLWMKIWRESN